MVKPILYNSFTFNIKIDVTSLPLRCYFLSFQCNAAWNRSVIVVFDPFYPTYSQKIVHQSPLFGQIDLDKNTMHVMFSNEEIIEKSRKLYTGFDAKGPSPPCHNVPSPLHISLVHSSNSVHGSPIDDVNLCNFLL